MKEIAPAGTGRTRVAHRFAGVAAFVVLYAALTAAIYKRMSPAPAAAQVQVLSGGAPPRREFAVQGGRFTAGGAPIVVRAVGWDPSRPGELPWTRKLDLPLVEEDFRRIRAAGFNTIRTWAPLSAGELALAERHGLWVLQGIWVAPDGDFVDASFRRRALEEVARAAETSRWSPAVLGYLVWNEPRAAAVAAAGLEATRAFLGEVVATVRALDPNALIGYAAWPGLEALDDPLLDFVAYNLYPHRPRVVMDELGLGAYTRMIARTVARGRPLLISEFGAGVAGIAVFQWNDGWWKNHEAEGDELSQDPADPEEWFGLLAFSGPQDRIGSPRPALGALAQRNRAVLVEPLDGAANPAAVPVLISSPEKVAVRAVINGEAADPIELERRGDWHEGALSLPGNAERFDVRLELLDGDGKPLRMERRLLRKFARDASLRVSPHRINAAPGQRFTVEVSAEGASRMGRVTVAAYSEARYAEQHARVRLNASGRARVAFSAPADETLLTVVAFEDDPELPPLERAADWAAVEVRRPR